MNIPEIKINNEIIKADTNMKMKTWREYLKATSDNEDDSIASLIEKAIEVIIIVFNNPKVNKDSIDEYLPVDEVVPLFKACNLFLQELTFNKLISDDTKKNEATSD